MSEKQESRRITSEIFTLKTTGKGPDPNELRREREEMLKKSEQVSEENDNNGKH